MVDLLQEQLQAVLQTLEEIAAFNEDDLAVACKHASFTSPVSIYMELCVVSTSAKMFISVRSFLPTSSLPPVSRMKHADRFVILHIFSDIADLV